MPDERFAPVVEDPTPWHQRTPYAGVKDDPNEIVVENGRVTQGVNFTLTREAVAQIHAGVRCGLCHEAIRPSVDKAWPETCWLCKRPFDKAYEVFKKQFQGEEWVGTTIDFRKEIDRMDAELEHDNWKEHPTSGIVIPRSVKT